MRVLHLSTLDLRGGAARSAWRLHQGLLDAGTDSRMLVRTKLSDAASVSATDDGTLATWHEQMLTPWLHQHLPQDAPWFTSGAVTQDITSHPWVREADVLHLHWTAEWLGAEVIGRLTSLGKPLFWTFHDLWAVTCGNHYAGSNEPGDDAWQTGGGLPEAIGGLGQREFARKHSQLASLSIRVIAPSRWIGRMSQGSAVGAAWPVEVVPYGIETRVFQPSSAAQARLRWNLPADKLLLLFGCTAINERRKGFHLLVEALRTASVDTNQVALVLFGADQPDLSTLPIPTHHVGSITSEADMASLYATADAYLCPTLEDNLPNTVLEALACGVPVIGFATGGVPDMVQDGENGLLAPCGDAPALAACLTRFATDATLRKRLQATALNADKTGFTLQTQAQRCLALYQQALAAPKTATSTPAPSSGGSSLAEWHSIPFVVHGEEDWMLQAAAAALGRAGAREAQLRTKLDQTKARLHESKEHAARLKSELKTAKSSPEASQRKGWRRWFRL